MKRTTAEKVAEKLEFDGTNFEAFDDICDAHNSIISYSIRHYDDNNNVVYVDGYKAGYIAGDPVRHVFPDGSAIVEAGDAWDIEGDEPFSWRVR